MSDRNDQSDHYYQNDRNAQNGQVIKGLKATVLVSVIVILGV
jgi:hypothetical protein